MSTSDFRKGPPLAALVALLLIFRLPAQPASFINFETAPVHAMVLSQDASTLAVCNLPDGRVELFDVSSGVPHVIGSVPVGIDPVSLRFRHTNELWVVNHISSSINVVDVARQRVTAVLPTLAGPADVVFAGIPERAFISCARSNAVMVFDPVTLTSITNIPINGDRPKAMAVNPDGSKIFVAIFESGNASTILSGQREIKLAQQPTVVDATNGPYAGANPPPNSGSGFVPAVQSGLTSSLLRVSHIVKKNNLGRWLDDNNADWTEFVSGTNAAQSGRIPGWDMPDRDIAVIDTVSHEVSYLTRVMNICADLAVNPATGQLGVIGTDAANELRFEPNLQSRFVRVKLALIGPQSPTNVVKDLNPHLDYTTARIPQSERNKSIGDPRGIVWSANGERGYVTGMGSRNLVVLGANGNRVMEHPIPLQEGPTALALDETRQRLYVLNRFSASISVVDLVSHTVLTNVGFFDPTPAPIKAGRRLLYDTHSNSGLGQASCASCHVDARFDRLAWDLGDPTAGIISNRFGTFHPMKGPKLTQTFQGLNPDGALHWRADREGIAQFNQTFVNLLGRDTEPTSSEVDAFSALLRSIFFPPNPLRNFDNTLSTNLPLPGQYAYDVAAKAPGLQQLPNGNARRGGEIVFRSNCSSCHSPGSGLGDPSADSIVSTIELGSSNVFKIAQLRSLADKVGFELNRAESRAGFGFSDDGRVDTLPRLLADGFGTVTNLQDAADLTAFLLSFSGSDIAFVGLEGFESIESNLDAPAALGFQTFLTNRAPNPTVQAMLSQAETPFPIDKYSTPQTPRLELIARSWEGSAARGWQYLDGYFQSDHDEEFVSVSDFFSRASPTNELMLMLVSRGSANRLATDRDGDGARDLTEVELGFNPHDSQSRPSSLPLRMQVTDPSSIFARLNAGLNYSNSFLVYGISGHGSSEENPAMPSGPVLFSLTAHAPEGAAIDAASGVFSWTPLRQQMGQEYYIPVRVAYQSTPTMSETIILRFRVNGPVLLEPPRIDPLNQRTIVKLQVPDERIFRVQYSEDIAAPVPVWTELGFAYGEIVDPTWPPPPRRFYRAVDDP